MHRMGGKFCVLDCAHHRSQIVDSGRLLGDLNLSSLALGPGSYMVLGLYLDVENDLALPFWDWVQVWDQDRELLKLFLASDSVPIYIASVSSCLASA